MPPFPKNYGSCDAADEMSYELNNEMDVLSLPKNKIWLYFLDPRAQKKFLQFLDRRVELVDYTFPTTMMSALLALICTGNLFFLDSSVHGMPQFWWFSLYLRISGVFLGIRFSLMDCDRFRTTIARQLHMARLTTMLAAIICVSVSNGLHLATRSLYGECNNIISSTYSANCVVDPGSPPGVHFALIICAMLYGFVTCKTAVEFQYSLWFWAILSAFILGYLMMEVRNPSVVLSGVLLCGFMLVVPYAFRYQEMVTFEYYIAMRKSMQAQIVQSKEEIEKEKSNLKMVLSNVTHDLKTPLQAISAGLLAIEGMLRTETAGTRSSAGPSIAVTGLIKDMQASYAFMNMQINRALDISTGGSCVALIPKPESFSLRESLNWAMGIMAVMQSLVAIKLLSFPEMLIDMTIITDKVWFQDDLLCLLSNAVKYSPDGSTVLLQLSIIQPEEHHLNALPQLMFTVIDEGNGVPAGPMEDLFKPFAQDERHTGGAGMGLYSLALRSDALGGDFGFKPCIIGVSQSTFFFSIPLCEDKSVNAIANPLDATKILSVEPTVSVPHTNPKDCLSILLVDDAPPTLKILGRILAHAGMTVESATNGLTALTMMKEKEYAVVLMDIQMPIMGGIDSVSQLRAWESKDEEDEMEKIRGHQYIIGASACTLEETRREALAAGMDEFVVKPVDVQMVLKKVNDYYHADSLS